MSPVRALIGALLASFAATGPALAAKKLTLDELTVPAVVDLREEATLYCRFELRGERLYSVKWYKDEFEFYRFMPDNIPPSQMFPVPGVTLNEALCSMESVTLTQLSFASSGSYRCEVSTEAPNFETVFKSANMTVMALPQHDPMIEGVLSTYSIGDIVRANCTSAKSNPAATLEWFINGIKAERWLLDQMPVADDGYRSPSPSVQSDHWMSSQLGDTNKREKSQLPKAPMPVEEWLAENMPLREEADAQGLLTRTLGLSFATERRFFRGDRGDVMELQCVARVGDRTRDRVVTSALATLSNHTISASRRFNSAFVTSPSVTAVVVLLCFLVTMLAS